MDLKKSEIFGTAFNRNFKYNDESISLMKQFIVCYDKYLQDRCTNNSMVLTIKQITKASKQCNKLGGCNSLGVELLNNRGSCFLAHQVVSSMFSAKVLFQMNLSGR